MRKGCGKLEPNSYYDGCMMDVSAMKIPEKLYTFVYFEARFLLSQTFRIKELTLPQMNCIAKRNHNKPEYIKEHAKP